jgi:hypothetical protein
MVDTMKKYIIPILIILCAILLRFWQLGHRPLWIDEVLFYQFVTEGSNQEYVPVYIAKFLSIFTNIHDEFWLRFPFALAGVLCVVSIFLIKGINRDSIFLSCVFAFFPLFVFWSRMARPYVFGSLFIILGYRWWPIYFLGVLTTPLSIIGLNLIEIKKKWPYYLIIVLFAYFLLQIRPDIDRGFNLEFLHNAKRIWVLPATVFFLYLDDLSRYFFPDRKKI